MPRVSAILPVYGEQYIERSVRSLLEQTLDDIEFIFVDDRSPDNAYEILLKIISEERYTHLKDNIKIVRHEVNKGVTAVRRTGFEASTGDYIYQGDSDDWMDKDMLRKMWEKAVEGDYDEVECDAWLADGKYPLQKVVFYMNEKGSPNWIKNPGTPTVWNKIFKRCVYQNDILWPVYPYWEDYPLITQLAYYSKSYYHLDEILYYYFVNPEGVMHSTDRRKRIEAMTAQVNLLEGFMRSKGIYRKNHARFVIMKSDALQEAWDLPRKEFFKVFRKDWPEIFACKYVPFKTKLGHISKMLGIHGVGKIFGLS